MAQFCGTTDLPPLMFLKFNDLLGVLVLERSDCSTSFEHGQAQTPATQETAG
jgi:hypothetical protein